MTQTWKDETEPFFVWAGSEDLGVKNAVWGEWKCFVG
jgi:hypothetical protein